VELPGCSPAHNRNFKNLKIFRHDIKRFTWVTLQPKTATEIRC
jgi:hypothetical protein